MNVSCNPQPRWRPYVPQLIYEKSSRLSSFSWEGPKYNSFFQQRHPILPSRKHRGIDCLEPLGLEFNELKLVRVQTKPSTSMAFALGSNGTPRVELHLGSLPPNVYSKKSHRSTSLQPTPMLRSDTVSVRTKKIQYKIYLAYTSKLYNRCLTEIKRDFNVGPD